MISLQQRAHIGSDLKAAILKSLTTALVLLSITAPATAATVPDWVLTSGTAISDYPTQRFATGFGISATNRKTPKQEKISFAEDMARVQLALTLSTGIESEAVINSFSSIVDGNEELIDEYKAKSVTRSSLNLDGIDVTVFWHKDSQPAYALAHLDKAAARKHYNDKFKTKIKMLTELQAEADRQLAKKNISMARTFFLKCEKMIDDIEEINLIINLIGGKPPITEDIIKQVVAIKSASAKLWNQEAETLEDAAAQIAIKLSEQVPKKGKVQINALMLEDSYQYSQFSVRFRTILERAISKHTSLSPIDANKQDFTPDSSRIARHGMTANGADYLLSGTYFVKSDGIHIYTRLIDTKTSTVVGTADAHTLNTAAKGIELKPRNYLQTLQDHKVFRKNEMIGGRIQLETWTSRGVDGLVLEDGDELKIMVRVNQPVYLRFIYHLNNGARVIPDRLYMNYYIGADKVNKIVELPDTFEVCAPFGSETIQMFASNKRFPPVDLVDHRFDGEVYEVIADTLEESNTLYRGLKRKKKEVEMDEVRIPLTTIAK